MAEYTVWHAKKILEFRSNVLHMDPSRLYHLCNDVKGLSLSQALRQAKWHAGNPGLRLMEALSESVVKAKESGFDLSKTFVGVFHCHVIR